MVDLLIDSRELSGRIEMLSCVATAMNAGHVTDDRPFVYAVAELGRQLKKWEDVWPPDRRRTKGRMLRLRDFEKVIQMPEREGVCHDVRCDRHKSFNSFNVSSGEGDVRCELQTHSRKSGSEQR